MHLDLATLGSLLAHELRQDAERDAVGPGWDNSTLPDDHGRLVHLTDLMFTRPDGKHLDPSYVSRHMQVIARHVGVLAGIRRRLRRHPRDLGRQTPRRPRPGVPDVDGLPGPRANRHSDHGRVCPAPRLGATLTLATPLLFALRRGDELGDDLLSRRRLHDLCHSSASIQLAEGVDLALVSKRMGHSTTTITGDLYVYLLRSAGQRAA